MLLWRMMANLFAVLVTLCTLSSVTCKFSEWNAWSICSVECGTGIMSRERIAKRICGHSEIIQRKSCSGVCERGVLLSKGKVVNASSAFLAAFKSNRIVDGNKNNDFYVGKSCFMTEKDTKPWIRIDLTGKNRVFEVVLHNRGDCCQSRLNNLKITVGYNTDGMKNELCAERRNMEGVNVARMLCFKPLDGRYVYLTIPGPQFLTVCELEVHGYKVLNLNSAIARSNAGSSYVPSKAIDGNLRTYYHSRSGNNWWRVDLGKMAMVHEVDIRGRDNSGAYIEGSTVSVWRSSSSGMAVCAVLKSGTGASNTEKGITSFLYKMKCQKPLKGRYIKIAKRISYLLIREVRVFGDYP